MCETSDPAKEEAKRKGREEACKTFVEQTKQLITLASAFIFAPAAIQIALQLSIGKLLIVAELFFIISVLAGYVALGGIAGSQHKGESNVHNINSKAFGLTQFVAYLAGLIVFMIWFMVQPPKIPTNTQPGATASPAQPKAANADVKPSP